MAQLAMPRPAARAVDGVKRRWFERGLRRIALVPYGELVQLGSGWGAWTIPADALDARAVCYCVGAGNDISFDLELMHRYDATVRCIDPFEIFHRQALQKANGDPRFSFHEVAVTPEDGPVVMYGRQDVAQGGISAANIYRTRANFEKPGRSLTSLMAELGDDRIDLLKLDIEGSEYDVLESIDPAALGIRVLCVEFHHTAPASRVRAIVDRLRPDYAPVYLSDRSDLTFVRRPDPKSQP